MRENGELLNPQAGWNPAPDDSAAERYRCAAIRRFPMGAGDELVYLPGSGAVLTLASPFVGAAQACVQMQELRSHARQISSTYGVDESQVARLLQELADSGVLISEKVLFPAAAPATPRACIRSIGLLTRGGPASLTRCLSSFERNVARSGRDVGYVIADQELPGPAGSDVRALLVEIARKMRAQVWYIGHKEKLRFVRELARAAGVPKETVRFAILGDARCACRTGASRNALLLDRVDELLFCASGESLCAAAGSPETAHAQGLSLSCLDPTESWFYPDRDHALRSAAPMDCDVLSSHEALLGRDLGSIAAEHASSGRVVTEKICDQLLLALQQGRGRVVATYNGVLGDNRMEWPGTLLACTSEATRGRLLESDSAYQAALQSRGVLRLPSAVTVAHGDSSAAPFMGLDVRELLPPFLPAQEEDDGLFGITVAQCLQDGYFGFLPFALLHAPARRRRDWGGPNLSDSIGACVESCECPSRGWEPRHRLIHLGTRLVQIGSLPPADFSEFLRGQLWRRTSRKIAALEALTRQYGDRSALWAADVRRRVASMAEESVEPRFAAGPELGLNSRHGLMAVRDVVRKYGELLVSWPLLVDAARQLRAAGRRLAEPVVGASAIAISCRRIASHLENLN